MSTRHNPAMPDVANEMPYVMDVTLSTFMPDNMAPCLSCQTALTALPVYVPLRKKYSTARLIAANMRLKTLVMATDIGPMAKEISE